MVKGRLGGERKMNEIREEREVEEILFMLEEAKRGCITSII